MVGSIERLQAFRGIADSDAVGRLIGQRHLGTRPGVLDSDLHLWALKFALDANPSAATRMLAQIGEFLRTILDHKAVPETPLSQEIAFAEQYLAIEQTRLGPRLRVDVAISPETLDALVPTMLLQPLIENAVRHGIAPLVEGGTIRIESKLQGSQVQIRVQNSGPCSRLAPPNEPASRIGISNTAERLKTLYAADHKFVLQWPESGGCEVTVELPFRRSMQPQGAALCAR